ncbi:hypothetical protein GALMADRAFT_148645 [Galerina marginata CBS 339.88]|uniref:Uncharacterized protein n=1 Tax=Galerina marginata (strain CBS 339.88) TaxID=685588 RepID=A0A067S3V4_GALM3|nr:hypothetical protein GALMADRAFT_148645 [Galerina marginata CBS 339.88]
MTICVRRNLFVILIVSVCVHVNDAESPFAVLLPIRHPFPPSLPSPAPSSRHLPPFVPALSRTAYSSSHRPRPRSRAPDFPIKLPVLPPATQTKPAKSLPEPRTLPPPSSRLFPSVPSPPVQRTPSAEL